MNDFGTLDLVVSVAGWCLLHFVWQATLVGVFYALARMLLPRGNPRYLAALLALLGLAVVPVVTAWHEWHAVWGPADLSGMMVAGASAPAAVAATTVIAPTWQAMLEAVLPWLVLAWAIGVGVLGVRVFRQWRGLRAMLRAAEHLPVWQARARAFAERMGLRRMVPILGSVRIATPTLIGWIRPAVVLPLAVLARMPAAQVDLVLAHELAHLKRLDHLVNLFQVVLETLFFYHPVVHWISRDARNERELCCDALALRATGGERRDFVAALASLEEFRAGHVYLVLAASGGVLVERAWFIAGAASRDSRRRPRGHAVVAIAIAVVLALGFLSWGKVASRQGVTSPEPANNASVAREVRQGLTPAATLLPTSERVRPRPRPVSHALVRSQPAIATVPAVPVRIAAFGEPSLTLQALQSHPSLLAIAFALPGRSVADTGRAAVSAPPRPLHTVRPVYPAAALLAGTQGRVVIEFALDAAGVPHGLEVIGSGGPFDLAALQALGRWRFSPPAVAGQRYRQVFTFRLDDSGARSGASAAQACLVRTGTHICRPVLDARPAATLPLNH